MEKKQNKWLAVNPPDLYVCVVSFCLRRSGSRAKAKSGPETTTALAVLVLDRLVEAIASAEAALPRYARKRASSFTGLSGLNRIVSSVLRTSSSNGNSIGKDGESDCSTGSSGSGGLLKPQLCALVLTKNREVAASVKVRRERERRERANKHFTNKRYSELIRRSYKQR